MGGGESERGEAGREGAQEQAWQGGQGHFFPQKVSNAIVDLISKF